MSLLKKIRSSSFLKINFILMLGVLGGNAFSYIYQVIMGRLLGVTAFGELNALLALLAVTSVPFSTLEHYLSRRISLLHGQGQDQEANYFFLYTIKRVLLGAGVLCVLGMVSSPWISDALQLKDPFVVILLFLTLFVTLLGPGSTSIFQGTKRFSALSTSFSLTSGLRLFFGGMLVWAGFGVGGAIVGNGLAFIGIGAFAYFVLRPQFRLGFKAVDPNWGPALSQARGIFMANFAFSLLSQTDILVVKYLMSPETAGLYSSASVIGKMVLYAPGAFVISLFPMVAASAANHRETYRLLVRNSLLCLVLSGGGALLIWWQPALILTLFFGDKFSGAIELAQYFPLLMLPTMLVMILLNYFVAKGGNFFVVAMMVAIVAELGGLLIWHQSVWQVLQVLFVVNGGLALTGYAFGAYQAYRSPAAD